MVDTRNITVGYHSKCIAMRENFVIQIRHRESFTLQCVRVMLDGNLCFLGKTRGIHSPECG